MVVGSYGPCALGPPRAVTPPIRFGFDSSPPPCPEGAMGALFVCRVVCAPLIASSLLGGRINFAEESSLRGVASPVEERRGWLFLLALIGPLPPQGVFFLGPSSLRGGVVEKSDIVPRHQSFVFCDMRGP